MDWKYFLGQAVVFIVSKEIYDFGKDRWRRRKSRKIIAQWRHEVKK